MTVCGWARALREAGAGKLAFLSLNDGSCFGSIQVRGVMTGVHQGDTWVWRGRGAATDW